MAGAKAKGGKKNRKIGRWSRSPAMKRYVAENRASVNKAKRARKHAKRIAGDAQKRAVDRVGIAA